MKFVLPLNMQKYLFLTVMLLFMTAESEAQLSGIKSIPGDFVTIASAVTSLNAQGVGTGGVTFNVAAAHTENVTAPIILTATGTSSNQIVFQKNGAGDNPKVTRTDAGTLSTSILGGQGDAVIIIQGSDFVTFSGIDVAASNQGIEYGYYLRKVSGTNGCKNVSVVQSTISMTKGTSAFVVGIMLSNNSSSTAVSSSTGVTVTSVNGRHDSVIVQNNTIQNVFTGIAAIGYNNSSETSEDLYDHSMIGGAVGTGNTIQNFGGNAASLSYGIYAKNQRNFKVTHNTLNNMSGGGSGFTAGGNGLYIEGGYNENVQNNSITLTSTSGKLRGIESLPRRGDGVTSNNTISLSQNSSFEVTHIYYSQNIVPNSITINNNTLSYGSPISVNQSSYMIYLNTSCSAITSSGNQSSGTSNITLTAPTPVIYSMYFRANFLDPPVTGTETIANNTFSDFTFTVPDAGISVFGIYGIFSSSNTGVKTCSSNTVSNVSLAAGRHCQIYGYRFLGNVMQINDNAFHGISTTSVSGSINVFGIQTESVVGTAEIYRNQCYDISSKSYFCGIWSESMMSTIYQNRIYDITTVSSTSVTTGMCLFYSANVYNNIISELQAPSSSAENAVRGVDIISYGGTKRLFNNTVYLNATSSGSGFGTSAVSSDTGTSVDLRNNLLVNTSTAVGAGKTVVLRYNGASLTRYSSNSDANCLYAGAPGPSQLIFFDGTNACDTLAEFQSRVSPRDRHSVSEMPPFVNVTTTPYDLHINPSMATRLESGGLIISSPISLTTDYDGQTRSTSSGDIGADEFSGTFIDETAPMITYTPFTDHVVSSIFSVTASIADQSGVNITVGTKPRIYFRKSINANTFIDNTNATDGWKYVQASNGTSPFSFTVDYSLLFGGSGSSSGDTIQYFFVAQDVSAIPYIESKEGILNSTASTVELTSSHFPITGTVNSYKILTGVNGTITVGVGGDYTSFTSAGGLFATINAGLVTNNINVQVISDVSETGANALNQWSELPSSSNYTFTITPSAAVLRTISGSFDGGLIRLNGADRVTIDGRFGGSGKHLRFTNTKATTGTTAITAIQMISTGLNAGSTNNTVRNCEVSTGANSISSIGILLTGNDNDNNTITESTIFKSLIGISFEGGATGKNNNIQITNNIIGSATEDDYIGRIGILASNDDAPVITGNEIFNIITNGGGPIGMQIGTGVVNADISKNKIYSIEYTGASSLGARGLYISTGLASSNMTIANNVIYDIIGKGSNTIASTNIGIIVTADAGTTGGMNIYHNSVNLYGISDNSAGNNSAAIAFVSSATAGLNIRNNVFSNSILNNLKSTSGAFVIYSLAPAGSFTSIDHNNYYASGSQGKIGAITGAGTVTSIAQMQSALGGDANSLNADPMYGSDSNLVPQPGSPMLLAGTAISGFTTDILSSVRNGSTPTIGAYENEVALPVELVSFLAVPKDNSVELRWNTASEVNNYGFEIERRLESDRHLEGLQPRRGDNHHAWTKTGFVEGNGTTNAPKEYSYTDKNLSTGKYSYRLKQIDTDGKISYSHVVEVITGSIPKVLLLEQNFPNPFNPSTTISYQIPVNSEVSLKIYDAIGREVATLVNEMIQAGYYSLHYDASQNASGIYFVRLQSGSNVQIKKMSLIK
ncbi:MAG: T9SS type A sorting domain-containing protein [Bacteroidetes bacterium]|nr:T9SS type A sorting domain-containing protein [Bacteroidota bacterium]